MFFSRVPVKYAKIAFILCISLSLFSCISDEPEVVDNARNYFKGTLVDLEGNPVSGKIIRLETSFNQFIARFTTDENGNYEGAGVIYNTSYRLSLKNDGLTTTFNGETVNDNRYFTTYEVNYTTPVVGDVIQLPDLIYAPVGLLNLTIANNSGNPLEIDLSYVEANCSKTFENDIEAAGSFCYETTDITVTTNQASRRFSFYAVSNTDVTVTISDGTTRIIQTFLINQPVRDEVITFN
jgi:hypothetical protein